MTNPTDANGRQRTPTDAPRPLRETVAEAMHRVRQSESPEAYCEWDEEVDRESRSTVFTYVAFTRKEADAAIAAMVTALLSETAVEAARRSYDDAFVEYLMSTAPGLFAAKAALAGALEAIGAVEGETE